MSQPDPVVLVGGSGLGPWAWERVTPLLRQRGLSPVTPQLRATGDDATPAGEVTLADWVEDLTGFLAEQQLDGVTLVAHSFAGYVAAGALAQDSGRIGTAVFLDALLPAPGKSWFEAMGPDVEGFMSSLVRDGAIPFFSREQLDQMYPGHGIDDADYAWMQSHLTAQPVGTYSGAATAEPLSDGAATLAYVRCTRTTPQVAEIAPDSPGWTLATIDSGHWPMITEPAATAEILAELAGR